MGTRGLFGVKINGVDKLTYNHSDSYPSTLGCNIVKDIIKIRTDENLGIDWLKEKAEKLRLVDSHSTPTAKDCLKFGRHCDLIGSRQSTQDWHCLLRNLQGDFIGTLSAGIAIDNNNFILDSLWCEYAYIVNVDTMKLEVYEGFQKNEHDKGRFASLKPINEEYYPCALMKEFDLMTVTEDDMIKLEKEREY